MHVFTRLALAGVFFITVGMLESQGGPGAVSSASDLFSAVAFGGSASGDSGESGMRLAQLGSAFSFQRPTHETLDLAVRAFGYPVSNGLHLLLSLAGMVAVGIGVRNRCRRD
jgi:hypothetical protein